jgi:hypothetical protein
VKIPIRDAKLLIGVERSTVQVVLHLAIGAAADTAEKAPGVLVAHVPAIDDDEKTPSAEIFA